MKTKTMRLDIGGPKGNAYYILSIVSELTGKNTNLCVSIREEMRIGDYNNLLRTFKRHFPEVILYSHYKLNGVDKDLYVVDNKNVELQLDYLFVRPKLVKINKHSVNIEYGWMLVLDSIDMLNEFTEKMKRNAKSMTVFVGQFDVCCME